MYFTINKRTPEFTIYNFTNDSGYTATKYMFKSEEWRELAELSAFKRAVNVEKIDYEGDFSVDIAACPNKIYVQDNTLHLLINKITGMTQVLSFDLINQRVSSRTINHAPLMFDAKGQNTTVDNSFLLKDKLYYSHGTPDSLSVQVVDFYSGSILKVYMVTPNEDITFKNTPIIQEGGGLLPTSTVVRELNNTRQLIRKIMNGGTVIMAAINNKEQVEVSVGSYKKKSDSPVNWLPISYYSIASSAIVFTASQVFRYGWSKSARFKMLINPNTGEHIPGKMDSSINEKIEEYTKGMSIPPLAENLFRCNGKYYYSYYNNKTGILSFVQF